MTINPEQVHETFSSCLFQKGEGVTSLETAKAANAVFVEGIMGKYAFHPGRLEDTRAKVVAWLENLSSDFHKSGGGGMSFLNACNDKEGVQWTGRHECMAELFELGMGLGVVSYCLPREVWASLPGGVPYLVVDTKQGQ